MMTVNGRWKCLILILFILFLQSCNNSNDNSDESLYHSSESSSQNLNLNTPIDTAYGKAEPINADEITADLSLDPTLGIVTARVELLFESTGHKPLLGFPNSAKIIDLTIDNNSVSTDTLKQISLPQAKAIHYYLINNNFNIGIHRIVFNYSFTSYNEFLMNFNDSDGSGLQQYIPCNPLLNDQFSLLGTMRVINTSKTYHFYTNAITNQIGQNEWKFQFPDYTNALSPYFHVISEDEIFGQSQRTYQGSRGTIDITVYRTDSITPNTSDPADQTINTLAKFEQLLGPYMHGTKFIVYLVEGTGGMEYSGATISSASALDHEIFHNWFATGVFPRFYKDAWIDEALARWFDNGNPVIEISDTVFPVALSGYSIFNLSFPGDSYRYGNQLIAHLAWLAGGKDRFINILSQLFLHYQGKTITTDEFKDFLSQEIGVNLDLFFKHYVYAL